MSESTDIFSKVPEFIHDETFLETNPEEFAKIIHNRRSVRVFNNQKVPRDVVEKVLDWGLAAPNSSNLQTWEFYWVQSPVKKSHLVEACFNQPAARTAQELIVCVARLNRWKDIRKKMISLFDKKENVPASVSAYYKNLVPMAYSQGPLGILGLGKKIFFSVAGIFRPVPREPTSRADMRVWANKSCALACQNIMMGFSAHGFDTCPMEGFDSKRVRKILGLGRDADIVMVIAVGKRDKKGVYGPRIRMPREEFIKYV